MYKSIRQFFIVGLAGGLALSVHATAKAQSLGTASATILTPTGLETFELGDKLHLEGKFIVLDSTKLTASDGATLTVSSTGNPDPNLSFGFVAINPTAGTDTFTFMQTLNITGCPAGSLISSSIGGSLTDANGNGVTVSPVTPATTIDDARTNGVSAGIGIGPAQTSGPAGGPVFLYGTFSNSFITPVTVNSLGINLSVNLTGGGDVAVFTGDVSCASVPEPGPVALMLCLGASSSLLAVRRLRRRA